jgi:type IV secretory pathway VirB9-like protein
MATIPLPKTSITVAGQKLGLQFDLNTNETKRGVKMQFVLDAQEMEPKDKQELTEKIATALQKRFGDAGIMVDFDDRNPYTNVIGFLVPLNSISQLLIKILKGEK